MSRPSDGRFVSWKSRWRFRGGSGRVTGVVDSGDGDGARSIVAPDALVLSGYEVVRQLADLLERAQGGEVAANEQALLREVVQLFARREPSLTEAEDDVVQLAAAGLTNAAIAQRRGTTVRTVSKQLDSAYRKLGVSSRRELSVRLAERSSVRPSERPPGR